MKTLTNAEFKNYLKTLNINIYADMVCLDDEVGSVCEYYRETENLEFNDAIIEGFEYELSEKQTDALAEIAISESNQYLFDVANAFSDDDEQHALSLIY